MPVASALNVRLTRFTLPHNSVPRQTVHRRPGGVLCAGFLYFTRQWPWLVPVANASNKRLTRFNYPYPGQRQRMVCAAQVANCV